MARFNACALVLAVLLPVPASATMGTIDVTPAATLLVPYFEVNLADVNGVTTLMTVVNTSSSPVLVRVTLWTNMAVPTRAFDVFLVGYDVQGINIRDILLGSDDAVRAAHLGQPSALFGGNCAGADFGDEVARGYVTVDSLNQVSSSAVFPGDPGYFVAGGVGFASNDNVLVGDFMLVDPANNFSQGDNAVHIEANGSYGSQGEYTFYGREVGGTGEDNREPLATTWAAGFVNGTTDYVVWRDTGVRGESFACGSLPSWSPISQELVVDFDTETNPQLSDPGDPVVVPFPIATGRVSVGGPQYPLTVGKAGWTYMNLNEAQALPGAPFGTIRQAWVLAITEDEALGRFSHGSAGVQLDNASQVPTAKQLEKRTGGLR